MVPGTFFQSATEGTRVKATCTVSAELFSTHSKSVLNTTSGAATRKRAEKARAGSFAEAHGGIRRAIFPSPEPTRGFWLNIIGN